ncbi:MAG: teichoic acid transporter [Leptolyngbya sp.]|nr:MAG: teichoic acid transporter [Leptolyngbya sp.]
MTERSADKQPDELLIKQSESLMKRVIKGSVWTMGGYAISQVVRLGNNFLLARLLFPKAFGLMALVYTFLVALQMFSDIGINLSIIQNKRGDDPKFLNTAWTMQVIRGLILWIFACLIAMPAASFYKEPMLQALLPVVGFTTVIDGLLSTNMATANRRLSLKRLTLLDLGTQLIAMVVTVAGAWIAHAANASQELAVWALVVGTFTSSIIRTSLSHTVMEGIRNRFDWEQESVKEIFHFGQWIFFSTVLTFFALQGNNLIVPGLLGVGFFGVFTQAQTLSKAANEVIQVLGHRVLFASYSELARDRPERLRPVLRRSRLVLNSINLLACLFFIFLGKPLISFLYDHRYADAGWMLQILAVGAMVTVLGYTYMDVLMAQGRTYFMTLLLGIQVGIQLMTVFGGYHFGGEFGAIVGIAAVGWFLYPIQAVIFARLHLWQPEIDLPILGIASVMAALVLMQVI